MKPNSSKTALVLALAASVSLAACAKRDAASRATPAAVAMAPAAGGQGAQAAAPLPSASRALRITIETTVVVKELDPAIATLRRATTETGGYVGEAHLSGDAESRSGMVELHVPATQVDLFRARIGQLGEVVADTEKAEDVTEQRADIDARLSNARAEEKRLLNLLSDKTGSLADVVAVEKELASVRETIERMEAQERVLEGQVAFATIRVQLSTRWTPQQVGPGARVFHAAGEGIEVAGSFLVGLAVIAAQAGPTLGILGAMGYGLYRFIRALRRRRNARLAAV